MAVFADLPTELRLQIWELCVLSVEPAVFFWGTGTRASELAALSDVPFPRVRKRRYPPVVNTCHESRTYLLSPSIADCYHIGHDYRPLDPGVDVVFLRCSAHLQGMRMAISLAIEYGNPEPWPTQVAHLALSQDCFDLVSVNFACESLLQVLSDPESPSRALKEVSLVCVDSDVDLVFPDPGVALVDWTPAGSTLQEGRKVLAMRALLAKELDMADHRWVGGPYTGPDLDSVGIMVGEKDRTAISVKRMIKSGVVEERARRKTIAWKTKMVDLAHWWVTRQLQMPPRRQFSG